MAQVLYGSNVSVIITQPIQEEVEATEIVPTQFRPISLSATPLSSNSPVLPTAATDSVGVPFPQPCLSTCTHGPKGVGGRSALIYPSTNLVDEPITEEEGEGDGDSEEDTPLLSSEAHQTAGIYIHVRYSIEWD